jgi:hypothetical protein
MSEDNTPPPGGDPTDPPTGDPPSPATPPAPPSSAPVPSGPALVSMTSEQLAQRLREAESSAEKKFLKSVGFEKATDLKAILKLAKDQADADLSDKEKLERQVAELTSKAAKADALEAWKNAAVEEQFNALPETTRVLIDEDAKGDADERIRMMRIARKLGMLAPPAPGTKEPPVTPPALKPPANTAPPPNAPPSKSAPTKWDEYQALEKKNPMQASIFYSSHKHAILASKPASQ